MKKIFLAIIVLASLTSCSQFEDWLDVKPETMSTRNDLLSDQQGFQDALTGVYMQLIQGAAYGNTLSFNMIDNMAGLYVPEGTTTLQFKLKHHLWTDSDVESAVNGVFAKLYQIISACNSIQEKLDEQKSVFTDPILYNCTYGEVLGIRALCHLDVLRLFGPVPSEKDGSRILPYVTTFGHTITPHITFDEYVNMLLKDLSDAESYLQSDPYYTGAQGESAFLGDRQYRMNYYAVKGLEAIANLYVGNKSAAYEAAKTVINAQSGEDKLFQLGTSSSFLSDDIFFNSEHVFALYDFALGTTYRDYFSRGSLSVGATLNNISKNVYNGTAVDMRAPNLGKWWEIVNAGDKAYAICTKYKTSEEVTSTTGHRIPLIRLAEMYLIAVECAPSTAEAQTYWDTFETSRNVEPTKLDELTLESTLQSEYLKEFFAEGKMFYFYKRHNTDYSKWYGMEKNITINYVLPLPSTEITYQE